MASEPLGVRYAVQMTSPDGRVWWPHAAVDSMPWAEKHRPGWHTIAFQARPVVSKLYQKRGDAERECRNWQRKATNPTHCPDGPWTFRVRTINLTLGDEHGN